VAQERSGAGAEWRRSGVAQERSGGLPPVRILLANCYRPRGGLLGATPKVRRRSTQRPVFGTLGQAPVHQSTPCLLTIRQQYPYGGQSPPTSRTASRRGLPQSLRLPRSDRRTQGMCFWRAQGGTTGARQSPLLSGSSSGTGLALRCSSQCVRMQLPGTMPRRAASDRLSGSSLGKQEAAPSVPEGRLKQRRRSHPGTALRVRSPALASDLPSSVIRLDSGGYHPL